MDEEHNLSFIETVPDDEVLNLLTPRAALATEIGGTPYLFVAGASDSGVSVFSIATDGTLTNVDNVTDDGTLQIGAARALATAEVDGTTYLYVAGEDDSGISGFSVGSDGHLTNGPNVADDLTLELAGASALATTVVDGTAFLVAAGRNDAGLSVFSIGSGGALTNTDNVDQLENSAYELTDMVSIATATIGNSTYVFTGAGTGGNGVSVFSLDAAGQLTNVANVDDSENPNYQLATVRAVTTAVVDGTTYLFAAGAADGGVSVFAVGSDGSLTNVENITDGAGLNLQGASGLSTTVIAGETYLFVTAFDGDAVSMFHVADNGSLDLVDTAGAPQVIVQRPVTNSVSPADASVSIDGPWAATNITVGSAHYLFTTAVNDDSLSSFLVGGNQPPELTVDHSGVAFDENVVNATPQLIFPDVTVTDPDFNLGGGMLLVHGHLAEDTISASSATGSGPARSTFPPAMSSMKARRSEPSPAGPPARRWRCILASV